MVDVYSFTNPSWDQAELWRKKVKEEHKRLKKIGAIKPNTRIWVKKYFVKKRLTKIKHTQEARKKQAKIKYKEIKNITTRMAEIIVDGNTHKLKWSWKDAVHLDSTIGDEESEEESVIGM